MLLILWILLEWGPFCDNSISLSIPACIHPYASTCMTYIGLLGQVRRQASGKRIHATTSRHSRGSTGTESRQHIFSKEIICIKKLKKRPKIYSYYSYHYFSTTSLAWGRFVPTRASVILARWIYNSAHPAQFLTVFVGTSSLLSSWNS